MTHKLLIVESPGKVKKLQSFLGSDWKVVASVGHIRDLPPSEMGYELQDDNLTINYEINSDKKKVVSNIRKLADGCSEIYLATDEDREGEAIAWHLKIALGNRYKYQRSSFTEITKTAVLNAIASPRKLDMNLVNAQQARRIVDRIIGYKVSGIVNKKLASRTSAGRVQSPAVRLVVERDRAISAFKVSKCYSLKGFFNTDNSSENLLSELKKIGDKNIGYENDDKTIFINSLDELNQIIEEIQNSNFKISSIVPKKISQKPFPPFITSTLQRAADIKLNFSIDQTTRLAQKLYEGGFITYLRTDAPAISEEALDMVRNYISDNFEENYLSEKPNIFKSKGDSQEAHECIRPTKILEDGSGISDSDERKLYELIRNQFIACQMSNAIYFKVTVEISDGKYLFISNNRIQKFDGWGKIFGNIESNIEDKTEKKDDDFIQEGVPFWVKQGRDCDVEKIENLEKKTKPPAFYTEASLVKDLEKNGIGRPSTYASILKNIIGRSYIKKEGKKVKSTELGGKLIDMLLDIFPGSWLEYSYTKAMEKSLDDVTLGNENWETIIKTTHRYIESEIEKSGEKYADVGKKEVVLSGNKCPDCGKDMVIREGKNGKFESCSGYPECKYIKNDNEVMENSCPKCGGDLELSKVKVECKKDSCGFYTFIKLGGKTLEKDQINELLSGREITKISGFKSKSGKKFDAGLRLNHDNIIEYIFKNAG